MEDKEILEPFLHEHPLRWIPDRIETTNYWRCCGCDRYFLPGEAAYGCASCASFFLHKECAKMPRQIRHSVHASHQLTLKSTKNWGSDLGRCVVCDDRYEYGFFYICSEGCDQVWFHFGCSVGGMEVAPEENFITHTSHPQHGPLRKMRASAFECDACGGTEKGNSYLCIICSYWIHETCALLPTIVRFDHHQDHPLSLTFHLPYEYCKYRYTCAICSGSLRLRHWVYHCEICRYVVHINCATKTSPAAASSIIDDENGAGDDKDILKAPIEDMYEEMIKPFVVRLRGEISIPHHDNHIISTSNFYKHDHPLSFITFSSYSDDHNEEEDDDDCEGSALICDGCTVPINQTSNNEGYMSCGECKYFLHLACFNLPPLLPSHPLHQIEGHELSLERVSNLNDEHSNQFMSMTVSFSSHLILSYFCTYCYICGRFTNGLFYSCTDRMCRFKIDIKCASLPNTVKHAAHPQHHHHLKLLTDNLPTSSCSACDSYLGVYRCDMCRFFVCEGCVLLPPRNKHRLENHVLPLTYNACVNHPGDFYCSNCEQKMNPNSWMYHCRDCDQSFHPRCFPATSGPYRNINFGRQMQYRTSHHPHHSFRFQIISKKKYCNVCHRCIYDLPGFQCTSCNFVVCAFHIDSK